MCILLVEDEFIIRMSAQVALEQAGFDVLDVEHGEAAHDVLANHPARFTCLVTDYHLSGVMTGAHVISRMREDYPAIPMVLASAYPHATTATWRAGYGVSLLVKPYDPDDLVDLVSRLMH